MCWCSGGLQGRLEGGGPERLTRPHSHLLRRLSTSSYLARHPLSRWSRKDFFRPSHTRSAVLLQLPNPTPSSPMLAGSLLDATDLVREKSKLTQIKVFRKQPRALDLLLPSSPPTWLSWIPGCPLCKLVAGTARPRCRLQGALLFCFSVLVFHSSVSDWKIHQRFFLLFLPHELRK